MTDEAREYAATFEADPRIRIQASYDNAGRTIGMDVVINVEGVSSADINRIAECLANAVGRPQGNAPEPPETMVNTTTETVGSVDFLPFTGRQPMMRSSSAG